MWHQQRSSRIICDIENIVVVATLCQIRMHTLHGAHMSNNMKANSIYCVSVNIYQGVSICMCVHWYTVNSAR